AGLDRVWQQESDSFTPTRIKPSSLFMREDNDLSRDLSIQLFGATCDEFTTMSNAHTRIDCNSNARNLNIREENKKKLFGVGLGILEYDQEYQYIFGIGLFKKINLTVPKKLQYTHRF
ncbi:hypothetical protein ACJX0J_039353, partial [Zea mays]